MTVTDRPIVFTETVGVGYYEKCVSLSSLSANEKCQLWTHLKVAHPDIAAELTVMSGDAGFCRLLSEFDGDWVLPQRYFPAELRK
tara:strand:- start:4979 stop:5233 length:255 start_codon:yes stop_codon:yes gene_type:complete